MLNLFKKKSKRYLALDIGRQNIKLMSFLPGKAFADMMMIKATPKGAFQKGLLVDSAPLCDLLSQCLTEMEFEDELSVIAGVSGMGVIAKKIDIPQMEESMISEFVEIEAEQELFYNKEEMDLDYEILKGVNFNKPEAQSLLVVTVLKQIIENYNSVIQKIHLNCDILDTNFSALFNIVEHNIPLDMKKIYMVIDIGCASTNLIILIKNQVVFARNLSIGGDFFNQEIQKRMSLDPATAEELKISASQGQEAPKELVSLIVNNLNDAFVEELLSCYNLYHSLFPEKNVQEGFVTGGASQTLNLTQKIKDKMGFPVSFFNPFKNIDLKPEFKNRQHEFPLFSVVAGLSLRSLK